MAAVAAQVPVNALFPDLHGQRRIVCVTVGFTDPVTAEDRAQARAILQEVKPFCHQILACMIDCSHRRVDHEGYTVRVVRLLCTIACKDAQ
jgi:hypothetical protein